jgi:N-methylhydantoinase B
MAAPNHQDVVLVTVLANRLEAITREMGAAMLRSARSPIFAQNRDFITAVFDRRLRLVGQSAYIPVLLGSASFALEAISDYYGDDVHEGDVMILNDPFMGNNHLPDITVVRPVFRDGEVAFWALAKGHHADLGGGGAAGYNPDVKTAWEEGIRITPSKLYSAGVYNRDLWQMILTNVKLPSLVEGDLRCQVGATRIGERALLELLDSYGLETVDAAIDITLAKSEEQMRAKVRSMPRGRYSAERLLDYRPPDGSGQPRIRVSIEVEDDQILFDFEGSSDQVPSYYNSTYANTVACCFSALLSTIGPDIRINEGSMRPVVVRAPVGSIANASNGAATTMCTVATCAAIVEASWLALVQAVPELTQANWARQGAATMSSGINPRSGLPFAVIHHFGKGGSGACQGYDGWNHVSPVSSMGGSRAPDPELFEMRSPHLILAYELVPDSAGAGRWRGGHGAHYKVMFTSDSTSIVLEPAGFSESTAPQGICGGGSGSLARASISSADGVVEVERPMLYRPRAGDVLDMHSSGGGGYGDPLQRPVELVQHDVRSGLLAVARAATSYGVVINEGSQTVDVAATSALRNSRKGER